MARTIASSDVSTSIVIRPVKSDQITCGKTAITTTNDVIFATRSLPDGKSVDLSLDIQVPQTPGKKPLVVYTHEYRVVVRRPRGITRLYPGLGDRG
jgi:hypothetical protein